MTNLISILHGFKKTPKFVIARSPKWLRQSCF